MAYDKQIKCSICSISIPDVAEDAPKEALLCDKCNKIEEAREAEEENHWADFEDYPLSDWKYEVANDDTRVGYWVWVKSKIQAGD